MLRHGWRGAVCLSVVGLCACISVSRVLATASRGDASVTGTRPSPLGVFAVIRTPGGVNPELELRSGRTGALLKDVGALGSSWTNNGFALSPHAGAVYLTLIGHKTLELERIALATGARSIIADGEEPAVSSGGRELAFAAGGFGSTVLAVRDLASGARAPGRSSVTARPLLRAAEQLDYLDT